MFDSRRCGTYTPGHETHWIQRKQALKEHTYKDAELLKVEDGCLTISVEDEGIIKVWTHRLDLLEKCLAVQESWDDFSLYFSKEFHLLTFQGTLPSREYVSIRNLSVILEPKECNIDHPETTAPTVATSLDSIIAEIMCNGGGTFDITPDILDQLDSDLESDK